MMTMSILVLFFGGLGVLVGVTEIVSGLIRALRTGKDKEWRYVGSMMKPTILMVGVIWLALHLGGAF